MKRYFYGTALILVFMVLLYPTVKTDTFGALRLTNGASTTGNANVNGSFELLTHDAGLVTLLTSLETLLTSGTAANQPKRLLSVGSGTDKTELKATPGVLANFGCTNNAATDAYVKFVNLAAAATTPGTSAVYWGPWMVPHGSGIVYTSAEITFTVGMTAYVTTGVADNNAVSVGAGEVQCGFGVR